MHHRQAQGRSGAGYAAHGAERAGKPAETGGGSVGVEPQLAELKTRVDGLEAASESAEIRWEKWRTDQVKMGKEMAEMKKEQAEMKKEQVAMKKEQVAMKKEQVAMRKETAAGFRRSDEKMELGFQQLVERMDAGFQRLVERMDAGFQRADGKMDAGFQRADGKMDAGFQRTDEKIDAGFRRADDRFGNYGTYISKSATNLGKFSRTCATEIACRACSAERL